MTNDNYFSYSNISEMASIDSHIAFSQTMLDKYTWSQTVRTRLQKKISAIKEKQDDKQLNISVIGEFSTGKSSFINAIIGYNLLDVDVIQGTTVAITIIEYGEEFALKVILKSKKEKTYTFQNLTNLSYGLRELTTNPEYGKVIDHVRVVLPSDILKTGFRVIDTPGTDSLEMWHEDVTKRAISELSDMSIILVDATQPMTETLVKFVKNNIDDAVKHCAFVVNKIDLIKEKERKGILMFSEKKAKQKFNLEKPFVVPFSALILSEGYDDDNEKKQKAKREVFDMSVNSLEQLLDYTAMQKMKAQARKTLHLVDEMYDSLVESITKMGRQYAEELKMLERSKQADLKPFILSQITMRQTELMSFAQYLKDGIIASCRTKVKIASTNINKKIDKLENNDKIKEYTENKLSDDIGNEGKKISAVVKIKYDSVQEQYSRQMKIFQEEFKKEFEKLNILPFNADITVTKRSKAISVKSDLGGVKQFATEQVSRENWAFGGGIAAGAGVGTMVLPVIGTIIGGIFGGIVGLFFAPSEDKVKSNIKSKLSLPMSNYYNDVANKSISAFEKYVTTAEDALRKEIWRYYNEYNATITARLKEVKSKQALARKKVADTEADIDKLHTRQQSIKSLISNL